MYIFPQKMSSTSSVVVVVLALPHHAVTANLRTTNILDSSPTVVQHATSATPPTRQASRHLRDSDDSSSGSDSNGYSPWELYVGCFQDDEQSTLLEFGFISGGFNVERCFMHCTDEGATFLGLKYGFQCSCDFGQEEDYTLNGPGERLRWAFDLYSLGGGDDSSTSVTSLPTASSTGFPMPTGFPNLSGAPSTSSLWHPVLRCPRLLLLRDHSDVFPSFPPRHLYTTSWCVHNADPLTWSSTVASSAAEHAEGLTAQCFSSLFHSTQEQRYGYGANLYIRWGSDSCYSHKKATKGLYYDEVQSDSVLQYGGHATQILWKAAEQVGCAGARCTNGGTPHAFLVCQYDPPGNSGGQYEEQVGLPDSRKSC
ncbi:unnamed protein product [Ectocarpus sp. CCAP 1310/34]|nr:unnamed protein product [Ectocarpus sp. CCAP 1310/34]